MECHYRQWEIDDVPFLTVMKMADFWAIEPPFSFLYYRTHFKTEEEASPNAIQVNLPANSYDTLSPSVQYTVRKTWMRRNPGKSEVDFFKALRKKKNEEYAMKLEESRKAKQDAR